jgi:hypothetical protein
MTTPFTLSIITLGLCFLGFIYFRIFISRKMAATELLAEYRDEVHRLIAEIDAATDRDSLLVEERIKTLRRLLDDTDKRITVYTRELERSRSGEAIYTSLGRGIRAALDTHPALTPPLEPPAPQEAQAPQEAPAPQEALAPQEAPAPKEKAQKRQTRPLADALAATEKNPFAKPKKIKTQIAQLAAQGLSPQEIASRLEISPGEVELALNLLNLPNK